MKILAIYLRFISRYKTLTLIYVMGLSLGLAACLFIGLYVRDELTYDRHHRHFGRIFNITSNFKTEQSLDLVATATVALAPALKQDFPEVETAGRFREMTSPTVKVGDQLFKEADFYEADPDVFEIFDFPLLAGNAENLLADASDVVITASLAKKYFGDEEALTQTLEINGRPYTVKAVLAELPANSDLQFSALIPMDKGLDGTWMEDFEARTYALLRDEYIRQDPSAATFVEKLKALEEEKFNQLLRENNAGLEITHTAYPLSDVHFRQPRMNDTLKGNMTYIYVIASVAALMLLIASLNFINFSLVQSLERAKEVGIRKVIGARRSQLMVRCLIESLSVVAVSFLLALLIMVVSLPLFNDLVGKQFELSRLMDTQFIGYSLVAMMAIGTLAGSYPAFYSSGITPLQSLAGRITHISGAFFRKSAIVVQFAITLGLLISTMLISQQMEFIARHDLGYRGDHMIYLDTPFDSSSTVRLNSFKERLKQQNGVVAVSNVGHGAVPALGPNKGTVQEQQGGDLKVANFAVIDHDYLETMRMNLTEGRTFDPARPGDRRQTVIVNETFAKTWGWNEPLNETLWWDGRDYEVIGVVKDFHFATLYNPIEPLMLFYGDVFNGEIVVNQIVRFDQSLLISEQVEVLRDHWSQAFPDQPFVYHFMDESIAEQYRNEQKALNLFSVFSALTIVVSCLGLFGLCSLSIAQRTREVGIRKVLGATWVTIVSLFSKDYIKLVSIGFLLVAPVAFVLVSRWLESFPWRVEISPWIFLGAVGMVLGLTVATVLLSVFRKSSTNPAVLIRE